MLQEGSRHVAWDEAHPVCSCDMGDIPGLSTFWGRDIDSNEVVSGRLPFESRGHPLDGHQWHTLTGFRDFPCNRSKPTELHLNL